MQCGSLEVLVSLRMDLAQDHREGLILFESAVINVASCVLIDIFDVIHPQLIGSLALQGEALWLLVKTNTMLG